MPEGRREGRRPPANGIAPLNVREGVYLHICSNPGTRDCRGDEQEGEDGFHISFPDGKNSFAGSKGISGAVISSHASVW